MSPLSLLNQANDYFLIKFQISRQFLLILTIDWNFFPTFCLDLVSFFYIFKIVGTKILVGIKVKWKFDLKFALGGVDQ